MRSWSWRTGLNAHLRPSFLFGRGPTPYMFRKESNAPDETIAGSGRVRHQPDTRALVRWRGIRAPLRRSRCAVSLARSLDPACAITHGPPVVSRRPYMGALRGVTGKPVQDRRGPATVSRELFASCHSVAAGHRGRRRKRWATALNLRARRPTQRAWQLRVETERGHEPILVSFLSVALGNPEPARPFSRDPHGRGDECAESCR